MKRFYLDTAIWRDYFEDRRDNVLPLGAFAFRFLKRCQQSQCWILYSEFVVHELRKDYSEERIRGLFAPFSDSLLKVEITGEELAEIKQLALERRGSHYMDILHAVLARDNGAIMVTRDAHFECLQDLIEVRKPEEVIFG